jgi:hypothetical protein
MRRPTRAAVVIVALSFPVLSVSALHSPDQLPQTTATTVIDTMCNEPVWMWCPR